MAERWLRGIVPHRWARYGAAFGGALVGATSWTVWNQSVVNEKVYTVSLLSIAVVMWLVVRWGDDEPGAHRDRWLVLIAYVLALTATNHLMGFLAVPALGIYVLWTDWRVAVQPWAIVTFYALLLAVTGKWLDMFTVTETAGPVLIVLTLGCSGYALWRSPQGSAGLSRRARGGGGHLAQLPLAAAPGGPVSGDQRGRAGRHVQPGAAGRAQPGAVRQAAAHRAPGQLHRPARQLLAVLRLAVRPRDGDASPGVATVLFAVLGLSGLWTLWKSDRRAGLAAAALLGVLTVGARLLHELQVRLLPVSRPDLAAPRGARAGLLLHGVVLGVRRVRGAGTRLADAGHRRVSARPGHARGALGASASGVLALALVPLVGQPRASASRAGETMARDFAHDILQSVEPYGILITAGDNDTFPLWYAQEVEGIRRDVTLANLSLMNTEWHLRQLRRRETPEFDPARAAPLWRELEPPPRPTEPALSIPLEEIDSLPEAMRVPPEGGVAFDSLQLRFGQDVLLRQDLATIFLIRDNLGRSARSSSAGATADIPTRPSG